MKMFSKMDQVHTSEKWIEDTLELCKATEKASGKASEEKKTGMRKFRKLYPVLAAAAAIVIIVPLSTVAANRLRSVSVTEDTNGATVVVNRATIATDDIVPMIINVSYLPDGMVKYERGPKYYHEQTPNQGGFSLHLWRLDNETDNFEFPVKDAIDSQKIDINGYEAVLIQKEKSNNVGISFDRQMFIYYADKGYVVQIYIGDDMTESEIKSFAMGLSLEETTEDVADGTWSKYIKQNETKSVAVTNNKLSQTVKAGAVIDKTTFTELYNIGDPVMSKAQNFTSVQYTVKNVTVQKNFNGITEDSIGRPADYSEYVNADGQLKEDGYSVVIIDLKYKNIGDSAMKYEYCVCPYIQALTEENDQYVIQATTTGAGNDSTLFSLGYNEGEFSFSSDQKGTHNEVAPLAAGQEASVRLAFIVKDEYLKNMFLVQNQKGYDIISENQYIDIRQK